MNVNLTKIDEVNGLLTILIQENDYQEDVRKELAKLGRTRPIKGFRPGHVPASILQKYYGNDVLASVIDHQVSKAMTDYIVQNKVNVLGEPMLNKDTKIDLNAKKEFEFKFDLGLAPEFDLVLDKSVKVPYYTIEVSEDMVNDRNETYRRRYGKQVPGEVADAEAMLRGSMVELNDDGTEKEDGIKVEKTILSPQYLKDEEQKAKFNGVKLNDEVVFNPHKAADGNLTEIAAMLNIDKEQVTESDFKMTVTEIMVNQDAEMNQEFFDNVLGKDIAKNEEEYRAKLKELIAAQLKNDSNYRFTVDTEHVLREQVGEIALPDDFLKRFLAARSKENDVEKVAEEYDKRTAGQIRWQLIREKAMELLKVDITKEDVQRLARFYAAQQFAQYGMTNLPEDVIERYANELLEKEDVASDIRNRAMEDKLYAAIKEAVTIDEKTVSVDEFNKLFEAEK